MAGSYDEIISENPFFIELKKEYTSLFHHCISESWIICVPRIGSLTTRVFTVEDFCAHILVPSDELPETHYSTLTEKQATVANKVITLEVTKGLPLQSHILFEETFYTEDFIKYMVWCIETPLEPSTSVSENVSKDCLTCINDCIDLLWTQAAGRQVLDQIELNVQLFLKKHTTLPIAIAPLKDLISDLYTQSLQSALQNRRLREKTKNSKHLLENIKLAVESYMQHLLFDTIFKAICTSCAYEDSHLNKKIRNMCDIQLRDLDIKKELYHAVPKAKQILSKINTYNTVLEKVICLKQALNTVNKIDSSNNVVLLTADDLLPVFVFLLIKSGLPNWYSHLTYMKEFRLSGLGKSEGDESDFLITTLEAVIEHIQSGALTGPPNPEAYYYDSNFTIDDNINNNRKSSLTESVSTSSGREETLEYVFDLIKANHIEQVGILLEKNQKHIDSIQKNYNFAVNIAADEQDDDDEDEEDEYENMTEIYQKLCHPLCNCRKCSSKISKNLVKISPTVSSRDSHGLTPLHVACIHGKASIVEILIDMGAEVDTTDLNECTPLHYAASRGHQNALLLLLHSGAKVNKINIDKNTPLHLAVNNGHLNCVKALIYFAEHGRKNIMINCKNENGNTPLHLASKWGYEGIAKLLIENGAEPSLQNNNNKTSFDYAHNLKILNVLKSSTPNLFEYIHITSSQVKTLNCKSDDFVSLKLQNLKIKPNETSNTSKTIENLKRIDRILQAITFGDVKLACFYMNIDYDNYVNTKSEINRSLCHPLCECSVCKNTNLRVSDYDVDFADTNGFTALHYASQYGLDELCNILLLNKSNVNCFNKKGETPLHMASTNNRISVIKVLLNNGANINAIDISGNTPLHNACEMGNIGAAKTLLCYKPDITLLNGSNKTALDVAKAKVHLTIIDLIDKHTKQ